MNQTYNASTATTHRKVPMKKSLIVLAALAAASAFAAQPSAEFLKCDAQAVGGNWNQGVCLEAKERIELRQKPVTFDSLTAEMAKINAEDTADFVAAFNSAPNGGAIAGPKVRRNSR